MTLGPRDAPRAERPPDSIDDPEIADGSAGHEPVRPRRARMRIGIAAAAVLAFTLSLTCALAVTPFRPADENSHVGYVDELARNGRIPAVGEPVHPALPGQRPTGQHTSNHPPLFYALQVPFWALGTSVGEPWIGFYAGRIFSALLGAIAAALIGLLGAHVASRNRHRVGIAAALYVATFAPFVVTAGLFHNDSTGAATAALVLLGLIGLARHPTGRVWPWWCLGVGSVLAVLSRAQNFGVVGLSLLGIVGLGVLAYRCAETPADRVTVVRSYAIRTALLTVGWMAAAAPFYLHNLRLYGGLTGGEAVTAVVHLAPRGESFFDDLFAPGTWLTLLINQSFWVGRHTSPPPAPLWWSYGTLALITVGVLTLTARCMIAVRRRRERGLPLADRATAPVVLVRILLGGLVLAHVVQACWHVFGGGNLHGRYMFGALGALATVAAAGLLALPGGRRGSFVVAVAVVQLGLTLASIGYLATSTSGKPMQPGLGFFERILTGLSANGFGTWVPWLLGIAIVAAAGTAGWMLWTTPTAEPAAAGDD